ncbi:MAG: hypothetical protein HQ517_01195, partial [SAR324 cluster bacterium]|nr:hypothetical protein [SAR324 cluster bacterium]
VSFIMLAMNIIGNYTLIYGRFGFPELGVVGAGWASTPAAGYTISISCSIFLATALILFNRQARHYLEELICTCR